MAIHENITRSEYDALPGINWSALKCGIGKTAAHIKAAKSGRKDSAALRFGRLFHLAVLQPDLFEKLTRVETKTTIKPDCITADEEDAISDMSARVCDLGLADITHKETALTWVYGGVSCKCLIDGIAVDFLFELKSTKDASPQTFGSEVLRYKYHAQCAFYLEGLSRNGFAIHQARIVAVEKAAPYAATDFILDGTWIDLGRKTYEDALEVWADDKGPLYGTHVLAVPDWMEGEQEFTEGEDGISLGGAA